MQYLPLIVAVVAATLSIASPAKTTCHDDKWKVGQTVKTSSGHVQGHAASNATEVSEYLGIPYSFPPIGHRRFQPPMRYHGHEIINGTNFGFGCIQSNISYSADKFPEELIKAYGITEVGLRILIEETNPDIKFSEDCLSLNVWAKPQVGDKRKAVLVWVHGGSYVSGTSALSMYNGQFFADQKDVVLVTINYRLNIFGFPGNPLGSPNLGLLDQRMAVEWVRDNIAAFGGDPSRITLFGESAGGISVDHYSYAWKRDPIVHALVPMSGSASGLGLRTKELGEELWFNASAAVGCGDRTTNAAEVYRCMMTKTAHDITKGLINTIEGPMNLPYSPTVDNIIVFPNYTGLVGAAVPMMVGHTDFEGGLFRVFVPPPQPEGFWEHSNQIQFVCPAATRAKDSVQQGNPTWRYRYFGVFPNMILSTTPQSGAYHSAELPPLFDTVFQDLIVSTPEEIAIGDYMRGAWAAFAKDPVHGLERYEDGWPRYSENNPSLIRIGYQNKTGAHIVNGNFYDEGC